jgi:4-hydroxy-tetrahydrodipicolinate synthase
MRKISGVITALVTPFNKGATKIDFESFDKLLEDQLTSGIGGVVVNGSTGESLSLSRDEFKECAHFVVSKVKKKLSVYGGISAATTENALSLAEILVDAGVDGLMVTTPFYIKPTQVGVIHHIQKIRERFNLPLIVYNIPGRSGLNLQVATMAKLLNEGIVEYVKESSGSLEQIVELILSVKDPTVIFSGDDGLTFPLVALGCGGVVSVASNLIPKDLVELVDSLKEGDLPKARAINTKLYPIFKALFNESNPIPVKAALTLKGLTQYATLRAPLEEASDETIVRLKQALTW